MVASVVTLPELVRVDEARQDLLAATVPVFAAMSDPVVVADPDGGIRFMNVAALRFFRVGASAYLGVSLVDFLAVLECTSIRRIEKEMKHGSVASLRVGVQVGGRMRYCLASIDRTPIGIVMSMKDNTEAETLATVDALTGAYNRREFDRLLSLELQRADRGYATKGNRPGVSLLFIDADFFHDVNERYGHQGGDAVLRQLVETVKFCVRKEDHVCRYGGEEFCVIMPSSNQRGVYAVAERVRKAVQDLRVMYGATVIRVTVSVGVATVTGRCSGNSTIHRMRVRDSEPPPTGYSFVASESGEMKETDSVPPPRSNPRDSNSGETLQPRFVRLQEQLVRVANRAMLDAKDGGRNCVVVAPVIRVL